ncbi:universal protein YeaZ [Solidesulfovibrio carbinoliphilus subsp. oakridgensis]|uniref:Universal protein YeaZ n=1 Tax=Solidesulfovibrio carbinoliphilus subsp. oakridgensis TaxID=694327 RepID=G7QAD5_9BACT|nr:tRNA (adenosine(37)-N6)-threonylcarbamoyltransferase complex dimerization subunit type 1 TsaB [Solidesulfovibrio carbinoliphilus]EHJ48688.1 universal protein YeaZ [Solidesulfovibrio carbinoliphilus subsp. oakridgensis]
MASGGAAPGQGPLLVLCGVSPELTVLCGRPGGRVVRRAGTARGQAAETLAPMIASAMAEAGVPASGLGGVACVRGPGSFTGIRVALATALGLSFGAGIPMAGLDFLPLLAASAAKRAGGVVAAVTHARAGQVYLQSFLADGDVLPLGGPEALTLAQACARLADDAAVGPLWLTGEGAMRHRAVLLEAVPLATFLGAEGCEPDPDVVLVAAAGAGYGFDPVEPLYLRPCDAEDNLAGFAAVRGLSPDEAAIRFRQAVTEK